MKRSDEGELIVSKSEVGNLVYYDVNLLSFNPYSRSLFSKTFSVKAKILACTESMDNCGVKRKKKYFPILAFIHPKTHSLYIHKFNDYKGTAQCEETIISFDGKYELLRFLADDLDYQLE
jgi:hypothetical protein